MDARLFFRPIAILIVCSVLACAVEIGRLGQASEPSFASMQDRNDPLAAELAHCRALGAEDVNDPTCKTARAKNRERFFSLLQKQPSDPVQVVPQWPSTKLPSEMFPDRAPPSLWPDANQIQSQDR